MGILSRHKKESQIINEETADLRKIGQELTEIEKRIGNPADEEKKIIAVVNQFEEDLGQERNEMESIRKKLDEVCNLDNKETEIEKLRKQLLKEIKEEES
jgi:chromosome segregation ATPase